MKVLDEKGLQLVTSYFKSLGLKILSQQYIRIWDLEEGLYQLTYAGTKYIYYNGSANTTTATINNSIGKCLLFVTSYSDTSKGWECHWNNASYNYVFIGRTTSSTGSYSSKQLNNIPSSEVVGPVYTSSQYAVGYYISHTSAPNSLNSVTYIREGEYALLTTSTTGGMPYTITENRMVHIKTYSTYQSNSSTYAPTIKQDLFITVDNRTFTRFITYTSSSNITYGDWIETTASILAKFADIPTNTSQLTNDSGFLTSVPIASEDTLGGIKVGSGLSINANGKLSVKANVMYPNKVISKGTMDSSTFASYSEYYWMILPKMDPSVTIIFTYGSGSTLEKTASVGKPLIIHAYTGATGGVFQLAGLGDETPSYVYGYPSLSATPGQDIAVYYISPAV